MEKRDFNEFLLSNYFQEFLNKGNSCNIFEISSDTNSIEEFVSALYQKTIRDCSAITLDLLRAYHDWIQEN